MIKIEFTNGKPALEFPEAETIKEAVEMAGAKKISLSGADLDYGSWPLWCGSLTAKIDKKIFCQLLYHVVRAGQSVDDEEVRKFLDLPEVIRLANQFHRAKECGEIKGAGK